MADGIDELARARLDRAELDIHDLKSDVKGVNKSVTDADAKSAERHGTSQAQNAAILAKLDAVDKRLNEPSALISLLGNRAAIGGAVMIIGALAGLFTALGYGAKAAEPAVQDPPPAAVLDETHRPDIAP